MLFIQVNSSYIFSLKLFSFQFDLKFLKTVDKSVLTVV